MIYDDDAIADRIASALVLEEFTKSAGQRDAKRFDLLAASIPDLTEKAAALRAVAAAVAAGSSPEAVEQRAAAVKKAAEARALAFKTGGRAVEARVDRRNAIEKADRERKLLADAEREFARWGQAGSPPGEALIAEAALEIARARVREAEAAVAEADEQ